jgi:hypothetical protein
MNRYVDSARFFSHPLTSVIGAVVVAALFDEAVCLRVLVDVADGAALAIALATAVDDLLKSNLGGQFVVKTTNGILFVNL